MKRPKAKRQRCCECRRLRGRLHIEWHPGTLQWQCSDDEKKCSTLFQERWAKEHPPISLRPFREGDRVVRNKAVGGELRGDMTGTVRRVTTVPHCSGGTRARIRVLWDNGHEGSLEDRQLLLLKGKQ